MFGYRQSKLMALVAGLLGILFMAAVAFGAATTVTTQTQWIDYLALLPGNPVVQTTYEAVIEGGLVITSTSTGNQNPYPTYGNKVVGMALQVPPNYAVVGVRICYYVNNTTTGNSSIDLIRIAQSNQDSPYYSGVVMDDATERTAEWPGACENATALQPILPSKGALVLNLRVNFANTDDSIVIKGLALLLKLKPGA